MRSNYWHPRIRQWLSYFHKIRVFVKQWSNYETFKENFVLQSCRRDSIRMDPRKVGCRFVERIKLFPDGVKGQVLLNTARNLAFHKSRKVSDKLNNCKLFWKTVAAIFTYVFEQDAVCALTMRSMAMLSGTAEPGTSALYEKWSWQTFERTQPVTWYPHALVPKFFPFPQSRVSHTV